MYAQWTHIMNCLYHEGYWEEDNSFKYTQFIHENDNRNIDNSYQTMGIRDIYNLHIRQPSKHSNHTNIWSFKTI